jgi:3'-phosphoadenosine 5'-phosphosulfate sulfotransferase (PAPS reductase)/FAD synthetase
MRDPFLLDGPTHINVSGGRTSGYMLWRILQAHGGTLPADCHALFANTGKERQETLEFLHQIETRWSVPLVWLEYCRTVGPVVVWHGSQPRIGCHGWRQVSYQTVCRQGEPFAELIGVKRDFRREAKQADPVLPNPVQRWCSGELKQRTMRRYMETLGYDGWDVLIGFRADEGPRVHRLKDIREDSKLVFRAPLYEAGVSREEVLAFWRDQPFDLRLRPDEGNCDGCFLKRRADLVRWLREHPEQAEWWLRQETETGQRFRRDRPGYAALLAESRCELPLIHHDETLTTCYCTD